MSKLLTKIDKEIFILNPSVHYFLCFFSADQPKGKRFTTAKSQNMTINVEELMSPSEDESEGEPDEWRPERPNKGRRISKTAKVTGVRLIGGIFYKTAGRHRLSSAILNQPSNEMSYH